MSDIKDTLCDRLRLAADVYDDQQMRNTAVASLMRNAAEVIADASSTLLSIDRKITAIRRIGSEGANSEEWKNGMRFALDEVRRCTPTYPENDDA